MNNRHANFAVEPLENRVLLDGNVRAIGSANTGNVVIRGDAADNHIQIFSTDTSEIILRGLNGTVVNPGGVNMFERILRDNDLSVFHRNLTINLGGGDDIISLGGFGSGPEQRFGVAIQGNLRINVAAGGDTVELGAMDVDGSTRIATAAGNDMVSIAGPFTRGRLDVVTAGGNDVVNILQVITDSSTVLNTGGGDDDISILDGLIHEPVTIRSGSGIDTLEIGQLGTGGSPDTGPFILAALNINMGPGGDVVDIFHVQMRGNLTINTASGDDMLTLHTGMYEFPVSVNTSGGVDVINIGIPDSRGPRFIQEVNMVLGSGDDELALNHGQFDAVLNANGGGGLRDCLLNDPNVVFNVLPNLTFELDCEAIQN